MLAGFYQLGTASPLREVYAQPTHSPTISAVFKSDIMRPLACEWIRADCKVFSSCSLCCAHLVAARAKAWWHAYLANEAKRDAANRDRAVRDCTNTPNSVHREILANFLRSLLLPYCFADGWQLLRLGRPSQCEASHSRRKRYNLRSCMDGLTCHQCIFFSSDCLPHMSPSCTRRHVTHTFKCAPLARMTAPATRLLPNHLFIIRGIIYGICACSDSLSEGGRCCARWLTRVLSSPMNDKCNLITSQCCAQDESAIAKKQG